MSLVDFGPNLAVLKILTKHKFDGLRRKQDILCATI